MALLPALEVEVNSARLVFRLLFEVLSVELSLASITVSEAAVVEEVLPEEVTHSTVTMLPQPSTTASPFEVEIL